MHVVRVYIPHCLVSWFEDEKTHYLSNYLSVSLSVSADSTIFEVTNVFNMNI